MTDVATGHPEIAKSILSEFANHVDQRMLPNRLPDAGEQPEDNTVDATLRFFEAVRSPVQYTNAPHTPRGCVAQAWSVAELLRAATSSCDFAAEN